MKIINFVTESLSFLNSIGPSKWRDLLFWQVRWWVDGRVSRWRQSKAELRSVTQERRVWTVIWKLKTEEKAEEAGSKVKEWTGSRLSFRHRKFWAPQSCLRENSTCCWLGQHKPSAGSRHPPVNYILLMWSSAWMDYFRGKQLTGGNQQHSYFFSHLSK